MSCELNVLALIKGEEQYIYLYDDASRQSLMVALNEQAADPHLSLNWFDAMVLSDRIREQIGAQAPALPASRPML